MNAYLSADPGQALQLLALAGAYDARGGVATVGEMCAGHAVIELREGAELVGALAVAVEDFADERILRIGAAGAVPGHDVLPHMVRVCKAEGQRVGARALLCETRRRGMVRRLQAHGWRVAGFILRHDLG